MAAFLKFCFLLLIALVYCSQVYGQNGRGLRIARGDLGGMGGSRGMHSSLGNGGGRSGRYRTNLYNDDDVYGYEANYPGGEALYINYRSSEARAKRGQEFARSRMYGRDGSQGYDGQ